MTPIITSKKKLKAIYNSSEFKSIPQYPKIVKIKNKTVNLAKKKLSRKFSIVELNIYIYYKPVIKFSIKSTLK